ncbi:MAG: GNAT family N-acetyltransferase [Caldilineaceae bacterium]
MTMTRIDAAALETVRHLWRRSRHLYHNLGVEDLATLLGTQLALLANGAAEPWGFICVQPEPRPRTLPAQAPDRVYLRAIALARGRSPSQDLPTLLNGIWAYLPQSAVGHLFIVYGDADWLRLPLYQASFHLAAEVQFLQLSRLGRVPLHTLAPPTAYPLRPALVADLSALAQLDAAAFEPLWHFGQQDLQDLMQTSRIQLVLLEGAPVGYSALTVSGYSAHLARLAVHPAHQGRGIGRYLLWEALAYAQTQQVETVRLNTQVTNQRAQQLYRAFGFRATGYITPVLTKVYPPHQGLSQPNAVAPTVRETSP